MKRSSVCFWRGYVIHWRRNLTPKVIQGKAWSRVCQVLHQRPGAERLARRLSSILAVLVQRVILICTPYSVLLTEDGVQWYGIRTLEAIKKDTMHQFIGPAHWSSS